MEREAQRIITHLKRNGYEAYIVGGAVRDHLLHRPLHDIDIATAAAPEQVKSLFDRTIPTGLKHGTITVRSGGFSFEVTTFRKESDYEDNRRPKSVEFVSDLQEDLQRRDFTMNAMALDEKAQLIDPFGGARDLQSGMLRCVGNPYERFQEDGLRMLRCIRFAAEYDLSVEQDTWRALLERVHLMRSIAMERVHDELVRVMEGASPERGFLLLEESGILRHLKEDIPLFHQREEAFTRAAGLFAEWDDTVIRWVQLWTSLGADSKTAGQALRSLRFSRTEANRILAVMAFHEAFIAMDADANGELYYKRQVLVHSKGAAKRWLAWLDRLYDSIADKTDMNAPTALEASLYAAYIRETVQHGNRWLEEMPVYQLDDLSVDGSRIIRHFKKKPGPWVGHILQYLLECAALDQVPNDPELLLGAARDYLKRLCDGER